MNMSETVDFVVECFKREFGEDMVLIKRTEAFHLMGCFGLDFIYRPLKYTVVFINDRGCFSIEIYDEKGGYTGLYRLIVKKDHIKLVENNDEERARTIFDRIRIKKKKAKSADTDSSGNWIGSTEDIENRVSELKELLKRGVISKKFKREHSNMVNEDVYEYNLQLKNKFLADMTAENLERYVLSELLSPIEDYLNAIKIINEYKDSLATADLLIVGANEANYWHIDCDFLSLLISRYQQLDRKRRAIVFFLIADHIRSTDPDYRQNAEYKSSLLKSIELSSDFAFANNLIYLADLEKSWDDERVCKEIIANISEFFTEASARSLPLSYFTDISHYIDYYVLGIVTSETADELIHRHRMLE